MNVLSADAGPSVAVVGSVNLDVVITADRRPGAGETVSGSGVQDVIGGKGANQAIAAAADAPTVLVASIGVDSAGRTARAQLEGAGVIADELRSAPIPTGRAYITLTSDGENSIIVIPMANRDLTPEHVRAALNRVEPAVVLCQLEVPLDAVEEAATWCETTGGRFLLNPSPMIALGPRLLALADPLIVNRHEAATLCDDDTAAPRDLARRLALICRSVVVTDGGTGAYVALGDQLELVPAPRVTVVDTTGAGDAFAGTLAARLAHGDTLRRATEHAVATASRVVQLARSER
ncbi:ribokinase [Leifsonia xyli]|uniref:ribokinase n=1 Tax=Leifsonia xyli TaxID=1575 RepID=UPI003D6735EB